MNDAIDRLKSNDPPLITPGCDTCRHMVTPKAFHASKWACGALGGIFASVAYHRHCKGNLWEPHPPPVPVLVRLKRWLIG